MLIFAMDDEAEILEHMESVLAQAAPGAEIRCFLRAAPALEAIRTEGLRPDAVFCDIEMPGLSGLEFAARLKSLLPKTRIVFVTGYSQYAVEAFRLKASGYLMKPVTLEDVREELAWQMPAAPSEPREKLRVQCFGHFEVFWQGKPVIFSRRQSKELLAFLIDREGRACTSEEIASALWEGETDTKALKHRVRNLVADLKATLRELGMEELLIRERRQLAIRRDLVDCDYYRMLEGDMAAVNAYGGTYMLEYSWAEMTNGRLHFQWET